MPVGFRDHHDLAAIDAFLVYVSLGLHRHRWRCCVLLAQLLVYTLCTVVLSWCPGACMVVVCRCFPMISGACLGLNRLQCTMYHGMMSCARVTHWWAC
jgi:hypothetical protein